MCVSQELAAQVLTFFRMGYTHCTFNSLAVDSAHSWLPLCSPRALADVAVGFCGYQLNPKQLPRLLVAAAADKLGWFDELQLVRLLDGLMCRAGLDLEPIHTAAEVGEGCGCLVTCVSATIIYIIVSVVCRQCCLSPVVQIKSG